MVDEEVENTLREISERVRRTSETEAQAASAASNATSVSDNSRAEATRTPESMARIDAYLTTTERAWDRLPPVISNRSGGIARLELWVKRRFKQATRWYSWEQINFNAAVHHALRDTLDALQHLEQQLTQARAESSVRAEQLEQNQIETLRQQAEIESQRRMLESHQVELEKLAAVRAELDQQRAQTREVNAQLADLTRELREGDAQLKEEQRVCFKQLSLEMSEAEVLLDRARRNIETRLDKLERSNPKS